MPPKKAAAKRNVSKKKQVEGESNEQRITKFFKLDKYEFTQPAPRYPCIFTVFLAHL